MIDVPLDVFSWEEIKVILSIWVERWGDRSCILYFLWIITFILGRHKANLNTNKLFQESISLIPFILIVHSQNAQYFTNKLLHNNQRRSEQHLNFQTDFGMAKWYSKTEPKSRPRKSYDSRTLYFKCPHTPTALSGSLPFHWQNLNMQVASSLVFKFTNAINIPYKVA